MASADKPFDLGTGVVCASFGRDGSWLSIGCLHPRHGFVELSGQPPFDEAGRGDPGATRRYRATLIDPRYAWLRVSPVDTADSIPFEVVTDDPSTIAWNPRDRSGVSAVAFATCGSRRIVQRWELGSTEGLVRVAGRVDRPALAEITEIDPPPPTGASTELRLEGRRLLICSPALPAAATVDASRGLWVPAGDGAELRIAPDSGPFQMSVSLAPTADPPALDGDAGPDAFDRPEAPPSTPGIGWPLGIERVVGRALAYVRGCTALALEAGERAILTDHRILPLSWTRDAYYQALLLRASGAAGDLDIVADHLRWLWRRCQRVDGHWMRSHHGNGQPKDLAFQADQQLYPFVELADLWRATGSLPGGIDWASLVPEAWRAVLAAIDPASGLVGTDENAADDRAAAPFLAGSQILLWYTARRLAERGLAARLGLLPGQLLVVADRVRAAFGRHFVVDGRWAYAVDGRGASIAYHDANDLPTALAPVWGFCGAGDPAWHSTMAFALSSSNPGFVAGPRGGLGSVHTPGAWPLGHVQSWIVARLDGDEAMAQAALERLQADAFADGMLPESLGAGDGSAEGPIRHWFAWPGAVLGALLLLDRRGRLSILAADRG